MKAERKEGFRPYKADHVNQNHSTSKPELKTEC